MTSYEDILQLVAGVHRATTGDVRDVSWVTNGEVIGVARDQAGRLELFLAGEELRPHTLTVRGVLQHHEWHRAAGAPLAASRLLLPAFGHFDQVCAFIATELLRNGADQDLEAAFGATEPIVELAIQRLQLSESAMLGLAGELLLLVAMCRQADDQFVGQVVNSWYGWRRSARDFVWDATGVEVKTTSRTNSTHEIQGVHQIEPADPDDGGGEQRLLLVSIGLQVSEPSNSSFSVPMLAQRVVDRLDATGNQALIGQFLSNVAAYGSESGIGYNHPTMSNDAPFTTTFSTAFARGYDMGDPDIEVLRREDVAERHHVELQSVTFRINLPGAVSAHNPIPGVNPVARAILGLPQ
ncbi:PD-(D/E)XK motif protein [Flexivirga meconopsidis]|uniref:PD-(D/E)XK motif protein n=1 Tax=Flexivirga meconopsidis TaxID=2977121 RepID=UPI00223EA822|nr:PD-(D/E)XK motif protein [Flexivirga meconopsidis]